MAGFLFIFFRIGIRYKKEDAVIVPPFKEAPVNYNPNNAYCHKHH